MKSSRSLPAALAVILVGGAIGFFVYRGAAERGAAPTNALTAIPDDQQDAADDSLPDAAISAARTVPDTLPDFTLGDLAGDPRSLSDWAGRPLIVNFWATWCAPCRREIPLLNALRAEHADQELEIIGVAVDFRPDVIEYANEIGIDYPILIGEQEALDAASSFGMQPVFPFSVFADSAGRIVTVHVGELHADEAALILDRVERVDGGTLELAAAQAEIEAGIAELGVERAKNAEKRG